MEKFVGKLFIVIGFLFLFLGYIFYKGFKIPFGRLPGDIYIKKENFVFYFPIITCLIISIILTLIFSLLWRE